jgi:hypothetical protein
MSSQIAIAHPGTTLSAEYCFSPAPLIPRYCTSILNRISDRYRDARLDIQTVGAFSSPYPDACDYSYLSYHTYFAIFDRLNLQPTDVTLDIGSGKGRIVCIAATYPIKESIGVEIHPPLCQLARDNAARMRQRRSSIRIVCQSALDFDYDEVTVIVMFHPFGEDTLRNVIKRWEESIQRKPRPLRIAYSNPILSRLLARESWLRLYECWNPTTWGRVKFPVHFYEAIQ